MTVAELFIELRKITRTFTDTSTSGMWNAEGIRGDDIIKHLQYDAGYNHKLVSKQFDFVVWESYTQAGTQYRFETGSVQNMLDCLEFLNAKKS
jgi:hypothetical protein